MQKPHCDLCGQEITGNEVRPSLTLKIEVPKDANPQIEVGLSAFLTLYIACDALFIKRNTEGLSGPVAQFLNWEAPREVADVCKDCWVKLIASFDSNIWTLKEVTGLPDMPYLEDPDELGEHGDKE